MKSTTKKIKITITFIWNDTINKLWDLILFSDNWTEISKIKLLRIKIESYIILPKNCPWRIFISFLENSTCIIFFLKNIPGKWITTFYICFFSNVTIAPFSFWKSSGNFYIIQVANCLNCFLIWITKIIYSRKRTLVIVNVISR